MRKLLYITTHIHGEGGVSRVLSVKFDYLIKNFNYQISVIETNDTKENSFYDFNDSVAFYYFKTGNLITYKKRLNRLICSINADVIVNCDNGLKGSIMSYIVSTKTPLFYERHCCKNIAVFSVVEKMKLKLSNFLLQYHIHNYSSFVVLNDEEKQVWKGDNIVMIPNALWFVGGEQIDQNNNKVALAVGRHAHEKGYDKLIDIWEDVSKIHPDWVLKIYGKKNRKINLKTVVLRRKLDKNIKFFDSVKDVHSIYAQGSMLLSTSISESFGLSIIEAMAFGLPVIANNEALGARFIIKNNHNGFLIKDGDLSEYINKIDFLIKSKKDRVLIGDNAKKSVARFNIDDIMNRWNELFSSIL